MADAALPGLSIAIIRDARVSWTRGFGITDAASRPPVDTDTIFEAGSMSKPVFAYAVMHLHEQAGVREHLTSGDEVQRRVSHEEPVRGVPRQTIIAGGTMDRILAG
jgi:hypothetical protein